MNMFLTPGVPKHRFAVAAQSQAKAVAAVMLPRATMAMARVVPIMTAQIIGGKTGNGGKMANP